MKTQKTELSNMFQKLATALENLAVEFALLANECEVQARYLKRKV